MKSFYNRTFVALSMEIFVKYPEFLENTGELRRISSLYLPTSSHIKVQDRA